MALLSLALYLESEVPLQTSCSLFFLATSFYSIFDIWVQTWFVHKYRTDCFGHQNSYLNSLVLLYCRDVDFLFLLYSGCWNLFHCNIEETFVPNWDCSFGRLLEYGNHNDPLLLTNYRCFISLVKGVSNQHTTTLMDEF